MDDLKKISETSLPEKENFYSHLNMGDITGVTLQTRCCDITLKKKFVKILK